MIRVLVVDDSALMRRRISDILDSDEDIKVISTAKTGAEAIKKVAKLKPDVVTLDILMPDIDGLTALNYIMQEFPTPVVIISANAYLESQNAVKALELGAVGIIAKPGAKEISVDIGDVEQEIIETVKASSRVDVSRIQAIFKKVTRQPPLVKKLFVDLDKVVAIGSSTGGPAAIKEILPYFSADISAAFLIVQHIPASMTKIMVERLNWITKIKVKEAEAGDIIQSGCAYFAPGEYHMVVEIRNGNPVISLTQEPPMHSVRPSVTVMMNSVAEVFGERSIGVLLTGMGQDGAEGMKSIKKAGGKTLAEDESTCVVFGMPRVAIKKGAVDKIVPLFHMGIEIIKMIGS